MLGVSIEYGSAHTKTHRRVVSLILPNSMLEVKQSLSLCKHNITTLNSILGN